MNCRYNIEKAYIYDEGTDVDTSYDPDDTQCLTKLEMNIAAHVQKLNKLNSLKNPSKVSTDGEKTQSVLAKMRKERNDPQNSRLITPSGVLAFEGLEDNTHFGFNDDLNDHPERSDENTTFVTVQKDFALSINPSGCKRYYDVNETEEDQY
jgi:hypothetical protein